MNRNYLTQTTKIPRIELKELTINSIFYKINNIIGSGMFGIVYLATDIINNRLVAIKVIDINDDSHIQQIKTELKCLKRLQKYCDKYVLCYIDSDIIDNSDDDDIDIKYVIVTKFLENYITLKSFKKYYTKNSTQRKLIEQNIKDGLKYIHQYKILHGDPHDENILIHPETFDIRFIDFGYCQIDPPESYYEDDFENLTLDALENNSD
jgi:serine/threonine protein kinase